MKYGRILLAVGTAVIVALVTFSFIGVEFSFAVAWGILAGILALSSRVALPDEPRAGAPDIEVGPARRGSEIARMAWSINSRTGLAGALITGRTRRLLAHRLKRIGLDIDDPHQRAEIDALIGGGLWDRLKGRDTTRTDIERALEATERLSPIKEKK